MKILHTSDWHLGQDFYTYDRTEEHTAALEQIREIVKEERPDVMVVSGDIFHTATPSNTTMKFFNEQLDNIRSVYPEMQIIVTAGNHDSSSRLESTKILWEHLGVSIVGKIRKANGKVCYEDLIIPIKKNNELVGYVIALPHIYPNSFPIDDDETSEESRMNIFMKHLGERIQAKLNDAQVPVVLMAHMAITGASIEGHDESIGGMDYIPIQELSDIPFDYLALGHIHCPQFVGKGKRARYCGTPIPVSFDEKYEHSVSIVEIASHGKEPEIRTIKICNPWPVETIPTEPLPFDEALATLKQYDSNKKAYIRLNVKLDGIAPVDAIEKTNQVAKEKNLRLCNIKWNRETTEGTSQISTLQMDEFKELKPLDVAQMYYANKYGNPMDEKLVDMFNTVLIDMNKSE